MSGNALYAGSRRGDLDVARAVAAFLVVMHHIPQYFMRYGMGFFNRQFGQTVIRTVEFFHVPTFMLVAGMVLAIGKKEVHNLGEYISFERRRAFRLVLPFLAISLLHLLVKAAAPGKGISEIPSAMLHTLIAPRGGLAGHLWFLYCLMSIFILWPLLNPLVRGKTAPFLLAGTVLVAILPISWPMDKCVPPHPLLGLKDVAWYLPIFALGFWYGGRPTSRHRANIVAILVVGTISIASVLMCLLISWPKGFFWATLHEGVRMIGYMSGPLLIVWLSGLIVTAGKVGALFSFFGRRSYDIYLLHVALVGHPLVFVLAKVHPGLIITYALFIVILLVTYAIPIGLGELIRRVPAIAFVMLGAPMKRRARSVPDGTGNAGT